MEDIGRLNLDYYEQVIVYKSLTNESYLTQIIDHIKPDYFNDKNSSIQFTIIIIVMIVIIVIMFVFFLL